jgi:hypothetical protein
MFRIHVLVMTLPALLMTADCSQAADPAAQDSTSAASVKTGSVAVNPVTMANAHQFLSAPTSGTTGSTTIEGTFMEHFDVAAGKMIAAMEDHARKLGVRGVIVVASMDDAGFSWVSRMKAVNAIKDIPEHPEKQEYPGYNFIGIAYSKAAEMADTKLNSGSKVRAAYQGEFGYPGGMIKKVPSGYILTVFSGATGEQDFEIAKVGMDAYQIEE